MPTDSQQPRYASAEAASALLGFPGFVQRHIARLPPSPSSAKRRAGGVMSAIGQRHNTATLFAMFAPIEFIPPPES